MSTAMLKQNARILLEVSENYEKLLEQKRKSGDERLETQIKNFKNQFLYLLTSMNKLIQQEKNAK